MAGVGYDPNAAIKVWDKMLQTMNNTSKTGQFLSIHLASLSRIEKI